MTTTEFTTPTPKFTHLSQYETWASQNWLHQKGTMDAQLHARSKLDEEVAEFQEAIISKDSGDIISEAGDVLWTAHASGANAGISPSSALSHLSQDSDIPLKHIDETAARIYDGIRDSEYTTEMTRNGNAVYKYAKQWFHLQNLVPADSPRNFAEAIILIKQQRASRALARLVLLTSYGLQHYADTDIETAMQDNYQKIEGRIAAGAAVTKPARKLSI